MCKEKEIKAITAKEARELADSSDYALRHIYKYIRERAEENGTTLEWCIGDLSEVALKKVLSCLNDCGFKTEVNKKECSLVITW